MKRLQAPALALAAALAAGLGLAPAATAADLGGRPPPAKFDPIPYQAPFSWTGIYVGAHAGYGWSDIDWHEVPAFDGSHEGSGWLAGAQIGYNWQRGRLVYGLEADITSTWVDGARGCCDHTVNWLYSVRGRAGLTGYDNRTLFYVTAGGAWADIDYASLGAHSSTHFGWVAGAGIERALAPNVTARVEYLYYNFDSDTAPAGTLGPGATDLDPSMHTVRFGVNFKF
jgi:outer membrane immunogenic protein